MAKKGKGPSLWKLFTMAALATEIDSEIEEEENEAKYGWRDNYSIYDNDKGIDPEDYETEEEYLEALVEDS